MASPAHGHLIKVCLESRRGVDDGHESFWGLFGTEDDGDVHDVPCALILGRREARRRISGRRKAQGVDNKEKETGKENVLVRGTSAASAVDQ